MTHARRQIREAVATALTGLTTTSTRVYQSRMLPAGTDRLPCLLITADGEEIDNSVQTHQARQITITVRGYAKAVADVDDTLDAIAEEVETAAQAAGTLSGKVPGGLSLRRIETEFDDTLEKPAGVIELQFLAGYFTNAGVPGTFI
jgi:hypothetical protein